MRIMKIAVAMMLSAAWLAGQCPLSYGEDLESITIGSPQRIEVYPPQITLSGPRSKMQLVVTGHYADGSLQDLTRAAEFSTSSKSGGSCHRQRRTTSRRRRNGNHRSRRGTRNHRCGGSETIRYSAAYFIRIRNTGRLVEAWL